MPFQKPDVRTIMKADQRAAVHASTSIDPLVIDRVVEGFDELVLRDNIVGFRHKLATAAVQTGYKNGRIPESDRPSAVDYVVAITVNELADHWNVSYEKAWAHIRHSFKGT